MILCANTARSIGSGTVKPFYNKEKSYCLLGNSQNIIDSILSVRKDEKGIMNILSHLDLS